MFDPDHYMLLCLAFYHTGHPYTQKTAKKNPEKEVWMSDQDPSMYIGASGRLPTGPRKLDTVAGSNPGSVVGKSHVFLFFFGGGFRRNQKKTKKAKRPERVTGYLH